MNKYVFGLAALFAISANAQTIGGGGQIDLNSVELRATVYDCVRDDKFDELIPDVENIVDCKIVVIAPVPVTPKSAPALGATDK